MVSVLIADDEAIERAVLKKTLLKNLGDRCRLFEAENGRQVLELVEEAKKQLQQPTVNVKDVGKAVGYGDSNYFTKVFRRITGMSPTEYRTSIFREE